MKNHLKTGFVILISSVICFLAFSIAFEIQAKKEFSEKINTIPNFTFQTVSGNIFTNKNLSKLNPKLFVYYNSECEFCQSEAKKIKDNLGQLNNVQIVFISFEKRNEIHAFAHKYDFLNKENIIFLEDEKLIFEDLFKVKGIPYMILYNKDNKLLQKFNGVVKIEKILNYLESNIPEIESKPIMIWE